MTDDRYTNKWLVLTAVSMSIFLATIDASIVNLALETLERELDTSFALVQWVVLAYLLTITGLVLIFARLGDMLGKKRLYLTGFIIFTSGSALCGLAPGVEWLIAFRVVQALGGSMLQALGTAILTEGFPPNERGKALGFGGTMVSLGIALGPSLGGILIDTLGWRSIFLVNVPVGIIGITLAWRFVPNIVPKGRQPFDFVGAMFLTLTLLSFSIGMTLSQEYGFGNLYVIVLLIGAAILLSTFITIERRLRYPMIDLRLFRNTLFSINLYAGVSVFIVVSGTFLYPFYLKRVGDYETRTIGLMIATFPVMLGMLAPIAGSLSDRLGTRPIAVTGLIIACIACLGISTLDENTSAPGFIIRLMLLGAGIGVFQSPNNSAVMGAVPSSQLGIASGLLATTRNVGQTVGIPILATIFAARTFSIADEADKLADASASAIVAGIQTAFLFAAGVIFVATLVAIWGIRVERQQAS